MMTGAKQTTTFKVQQPAIDAKQLMTYGPGAGQMALACAEETLEAASKSPHLKGKHFNYHDLPERCWLPQQPASEDQDEVQEAKRRRCGDWLKRADLLIRSKLVLPLDREDLPPDLKEAQIAKATEEEPPRFCTNTNQSGKTTMLACLAAAKDPDWQAVLNSTGLEFEIAAYEQGVPGLVVRARDGAFSIDCDNIHTHEVSLASTFPPGHQMRKDTAALPTVLRSFDHLSLRLQSPIQLRPAISSLRKLLALEEITSVELWEAEEALQLTLCQKCSSTCKDAGLPGPDWVKWQKKSAKEAEKEDEGGVQLQEQQQKGGQEQQQVGGQEQQQIEGQGQQQQGGGQEHQQQEEGHGADLPGEDSEFERIAAELLVSDGPPPPPLASSSRISGPAAMAASAAYGLRKNTFRHEVARVLGNGMPFRFGWNVKVVASSNISCTLSLSGVTRYHRTFDSLLAQTSAIIFNYGEPFLLSAEGLQAIQSEQQLAVVPVDVAAKSGYAVPLRNRGAAEELLRRLGYREQIAQHRVRCAMQRVFKLATVCALDGADCVPYNAPLSALATATAQAASATAPEAAASLAAAAHTIAIPTAPATAAPAAPAAAPTAAAPSPSVTAAGALPDAAPASAVPPTSAPFEVFGAGGLSGVNRLNKDQHVCSTYGQVGALTTSLMQDFPDLFGTKAGSICSIGIIIQHVRKTAQDAGAVFPAANSFQYRHPNAKPEAVSAIRKKVEAAVLEAIKNGGLYFYPTAPKHQVDLQFPSPPQHPAQHQQQLKNSLDSAVQQLKDLPSSEYTHSTAQVEVIRAMRTKAVADELQQHPEIQQQRRPVSAIRKKVEIAVLEAMKNGGLYFYPTATKHQVDLQFPSPPQRPTQQEQQLMNSLDSAIQQLKDLPGSEYTHSTAQKEVIKALVSRAVVAELPQWRKRQQVQQQTKQQNHNQGQIQQQPQQPQQQQQRRQTRSQHPLPEQKKKRTNAPEQARKRARN